MTAGVSCRKKGETRDDNNENKRDRISEKKNIPFILLTKFKTVQSQLKRLKAKLT